MKDLYIDFDGVILDTITPMYKDIEEKGLDRNNNQEIIDYLKTYDFKKIIKDENIINNSIVSIEKLIESGKFNVNILTHIISLEEGIVKTKYIRKYFNDITIILVPKMISKTKMVHTKNSILVDDYAHNLREWESEGGIPVRFSLKLNSKGFKVINNLEQLIDLF